MEKLFKNPGERIKGMAVGLFILLEVLLVISAICCFVAGDYLVVVGIGVLVFGTFFCYIPCLYLYAMGELVDKTTKNEENTREICRTVLLERRDRLTEVSEQQVQNNSNTPKSIDQIISDEEDRVESLARFSEFTASRLEVLQQEFLKGKITKEQYLEGLKEIK